MRILYLHQYFVTPDGSGGTRSYEMARRLAQSGHKVDLVTSSAMLSSLYDFKNGWNELIIEGVNVHVYHQSYSNKDPFFKRIVKFIRFAFTCTKKTLTMKVDVVFATSTPLTIAIPALVYKKLKKVPMVFEVRDLWPELPVAVGAIKNPLLIKLARWLEVYTYKKSDYVIGLSPGMCQGVIDTGKSPGRVVCVPNSCDTDLFRRVEKGDLSCLDKSLSFIGSRKLIVYTGTFGIINKVGYIVELAKAMLTIESGICFLAVGDGMEKADVVATAKSEGVLDKNLYFLDPVPKNDIVTILARADLALSLFGPIKEMWHNSANKIFDALASGTPPAINYGGWQQDFIENSKCGLVLSANDFEQAAFDISAFLNNSLANETAVAACKRLANEDFSRDRLAKTLEDVLVDAVEGVSQ
jgi:glycosyltransferase involved in cell wall biosynthesis